MEFGHRRLTVKARGEVWNNQPRNQRGFLAHSIARPQGHADVAAKHQWARRRGPDGGWQSRRERDPRHGGRFRPAVSVINPKSEPRGPHVDT
jgi:hypothetical protein